MTRRNILSGAPAKRSGFPEIRTLFFLFIFSGLIIWGSAVFITSAASGTKSNGTDGAADGGAITRAVEFTTDDFSGNAAVSRVVAAINFEKIDGITASSCFTTGHGGGSPFNREIYAFLTSPLGTQVALIEDVGGNAGSGGGYTYNSNSIYGGVVTVTFDDSAASQVGGPAPTGGAFRPVQPLATFAGEDPLGAWTLTIGDTAVDDPLCFYDFELLVEAEQGPTMNDQTLDVDEDSPNDTVVGTIVATDPDPGDKLVFTVTGGTGTAVFEVHPTSGQVTVADETQITTPGFFTLFVVVTDSAALTDSATITINVTAVNDAPVITEGSSVNVTMDEDSSPTAFSLTLHATDADNDTLTWSIQTEATHGTATAGGTGASKAISYTPNADYFGSDSFVVQVSDGNGGSDTITVNVTINPQNDDPTANDDSYEVDENSSNHTFDVLSNDTFAPDVGETLTITAVGIPNNGGSASHNGSTITYSPAPGFVGVETFTYTIGDGNGGSDTATVTVTVLEVNEPPVIAEGDIIGVTMDEDGAPTPFDLTLNASDGDGDTLTWSIHTQAAHGTARAEGTGSVKGIIYTPDADYNGSDEFVVQVSDGRGGADTILVRVTINPQDDDPVAADDFFSVDEMSSDNVLHVLANDSTPDAGKTLAISAVSIPDNGGTASHDGSAITYSPQTGFVGIETFTYTIDDGTGRTNTATVTVSVDDVNFPPVIAQGAVITVTMSEDGAPTPFSLTLHASDPDGDPITWRIKTPATHGAATAGGTGTSKIIGYAPDADYHGADSFVVEVSDGNGGEAQITVNVTIEAVNDAPTAVDDTVTVPPGESTIIAVLANDTDPDEGDTLTITAVTHGSHGAVTHDGSQVTYTPQDGYTGPDSFTYTISDVHGATDTATVFVTVGFHTIFLPMVTHTFVTAPDLVVTAIQASVNQIEVVVTNQGNAATAAGFWVDFYIDPHTAPTHANQLWPDVADEGIAWGVTIPLAAGESLTLTYSTDPGAPNAFYSAANSSYSDVLPPGTPVYAQVDSAHLGTTYGGVLESHEITGGAYNNVSAAASQ